METKMYIGIIEIRNAEGQYTGELKTHPFQFREPCAEHTERLVQTIRRTQPTGTRATYTIDPPVFVSKLR